MGQNHRTDELFSRSERRAGGAKHRADSFAAGQKHDGDYYRHRARRFWREWRIRPTAGRVEHDLGRQSQTEHWYLGIPAKPFPLLRDGRGDLFFTAGVTGN